MQGRSGTVCTDSGGTRACASASESFAHEEETSNGVPTGAGKLELGCLDFVV